MSDDVTIDSMLCSWPRCGAAGCDAEATLVDEAGVGWCDEHEDDALTECQPASDIAVFDPGWLWEQQRRPTPFDAMPGGGVCRCLNDASPVVCDDCPRGESGGPL